MTSDEITGESLLTASRMMLVVDKVVVARHIQDVVVALWLLFEPYFVFNIRFPVGAAATLEFIQSSGCADFSYGEQWALEEILSLEDSSSLICASRCMQTPSCRGYSLDTSGQGQGIGTTGVCLLLSVVEPSGGLTGCESRNNIPGTVFLVSAIDNERNEALGECPYYSEWQTTGRDNAEGEWEVGACVCPNNKRGVFCHLGYSEDLLLMQNFNTTLSEGIQHVRINESDYIIEISRADYNYTIPETGVVSFQPYSPRVHRYDATTQRYELFQKLSPQTLPAGLATFSAAGKHYIIVHKQTYVYDPVAGGFEYYMEENVPSLKHVSAIKRGSGEVVIAFAGDPPRTLFWWPQRNEVVRRKYILVPQCNTLKLFEEESELYAAAASGKSQSGEIYLSTIWHWNGTEWEMHQTLEQTNCLGFGLDVTTWHDVIYLAVTCLVNHRTIVFSRDITDRNFTFMQTISTPRSSYRNGFFRAGGKLYLVLPSFSIQDTTKMAIYRFTFGLFLIKKQMLSHSSYGVSVFQQHHDVYVYLWRRLNLTDFDNSNDLSERLSWSPLFKWV